MLNRGISLKRLNVVMLIVAVSLSIGLFIAMNLTSSIFSESEKYTDQFMELRSGSYDLQMASDYLTEQMQSYTVTGERVYLDNYFTEAKVTKRRENALLIVGQGNSRSTAYKDLNDAMNESVALMEKEYYAAKLTVMAYGYDLSSYPEEVQNVQISVADLALSSEEMKKQAMFIMHGEEYRQKKELISKHMQDCLKDLEEEMSKKQSTYSDKVATQVVIQHILTICIIVILLLMVLFNYKLIIQPLKNSVELIREEEDLPVSGAYEIRFMAKTYNLIHHTTMQDKEKLSYQANHDKLTTLYNRRGYDFILENIDLDTSALILFDINNFKQINDKFGHDAGDRLLIRTAKTIRDNFRNQDYICRIGGDEMAVVMVHCNSSLTSLIEAKVKKINASLAEKNEDDDPPISVSCGVAFGESGITVNELFKRADNCLYEVKSGAKKEISIFKSSEPKKDKKKPSKK